MCRRVWILLASTIGRFTGCFAVAVVVGMYVCTRAARAVLLLRIANRAYKLATLFDSGCTLRKWLTGARIGSDRVNNAVSVYLFRRFFNGAIGLVGIGRRIRLSL